MRSPCPSAVSFEKANARSPDPAGPERRHHGSASSVRGFTLIEMTVVMLIIILLFSLLFTAGASMFERARKVQAKNDLTQIVTAVSAYYTEYGKYPVTVTDNTKDAYFGSGTPP